MHDTLHTIPYMLMMFGWHTGLCLSMIWTPGLIPMLTKLWVQEDTYIKWHFSLALENLLTYRNDKENDTNKEVVATIVHAAVGGEAVVT